MTSLTAPFVLRARGRFVAVVVAAPALLLVAHLLPASGVGLALRLAGAAACVLLVPGALVLRALAWPSSPSVAVAASFALSLAVTGFALALVFLVGTSIVFGVGVMVAVSACAVVPAALRGESKPVARVERRALAGVLAVAVPFAGVVWWAAGPLGSDSFFHLARVRKLLEFDTLSTLDTVDEFKNGGLHPGYAFPLWHWVDALVARLAGVDVVDVLVYLPAILVPLAFVLAYAAGSAVFRSPAGGLALVAAQAGCFGFSGFFRGDGNFAGTGLYENLSQPQAASHLLLATAAVGLTFAFVGDGGWTVLVALGAAAFALTAVHPTYTPYVALLLTGFLVARALVVRGWEPLLTRTTLAVGAILAPFGLFLILLIPSASQNYGVDPSAAVRAAELTHYGNAFTTFRGWVGLSPDAISRLGPFIAAALLAVPLAGFAARRLWAALVLGGSLAVLSVVLVPPLFTALADAFSLSQARRLPQFLPIAFAVGGACIVLSRLKAVGSCLAGGAGLLLVVLYPVESYRHERGGPGWVVWVALVGGLLALAVGVLRRPRGPSPSRWAVAAAVAFVLPGAAVGLSELTPAGTKSGLSRAIIAAVRANTAPGDVVFSDMWSAYRIAAFAPVYINAAPPSHVTETRKNQPKARSAAAERFFTTRSLTDGERRAILDRWGADWVLVDKRQPHPENFLQTLRLVFEGGRYELYRVAPP